MEFCGYGPDGPGHVGRCYDSRTYTRSSSDIAAGAARPITIARWTSEPHTHHHAPRPRRHTPRLATIRQPTSHRHLHPHGTIVGSIGRVWCDQACQQLGFHAHQFGYTDYTAAGITPHLATVELRHAMPGRLFGNARRFSTTTRAPESVTPAARTRLSTGRMRTRIASTNPPNVVTSTSVASACVTNATTFVVASCGPMDVYSPVDAQTLQNVQCVVLNMTVLGQNNPSATSSKSSSVNITDQVWLRDLADESPLAPPRVSGRLQLGGRVTRR